jgi:hypothetical protein
VKRIWRKKVKLIPDIRRHHLTANIAVDPGDEAAAAKLWAVYVLEAEKYDKALVESWKSDMEGLLIFVRFSSH